MHTGELHGGVHQQPGFWKMEGSQFPALHVFPNQPIEPELLFIVFNPLKNPGQ